MVDRSQGTPEPRHSQRSLTSLAGGAGCGCKLSASELAGILGSMGRSFPSDPRVVVGPETSDDAGVIDLGDGRCLVQSVDVFTPVVDDPYDWGRIAAVNALSDIYAMGAQPLSALQILCWPREMDPSLAALVLDGAAEVLDEARCAVLGGHSIHDASPKFGLAVSGLTERAVTTNAGAQPGDSLVLTKALGTGTLTTANALGELAPELLEAAVASMVRRNDEAADVSARFGAHGVTDVTGFGLVGHLLEMCRASGVSATLDVGSLPALPGAPEAIAAGHISGGTRRNRADAEAAGVDFSGADVRLGWLSCDAQTSGGLLVSAEPGSVRRMVDELIDRGHTAVIVGSIRDSSQGSPTVLVNGRTVVG